MPKPNYSFEKRQRELAKKKKQDEKDARKREARAAAQGPGEPAPESVVPEPATPGTQGSEATPAAGPRVHRRQTS